jgi:hypothetical protein
MMRTENNQFGDFYEGENKNSRLDDSEDYEEIDLESAEPKTTAKLDISYRDVKEALQSRDDRLFADLQKRILQHAIKHNKNGETVIKNLRRRIKKETGTTEDSVFRQLHGWESGIESVRRFIEQRRAELSENDMVESCEFSLNVEWDVSDGVDVVERLKLDESARGVDPDQPYRLNLVQIKTSEESDRRGAEHYRRQHKKLVERLKDRDFLLSTVLKEKGSELVDKDTLEKFKKNKIEGFEIIARSLSSITGTSLVELAGSDQKEFTSQHASQVMWSVFTNLFGSDDKIFFQKFCALVASGTVDPAVILQDVLSSTSDMKRLLGKVGENGVEITDGKVKEIEKKLKKIASKLEGEIERIKRTYTTADYYATSQYYVDKKRETKGEVITDDNNPITVQALQVREDHLNDLYESYKQDAIA